jgi:hypothetical protein
MMRGVYSDQRPDFFSPRVLRFALANHARAESDGVSDPASTRSHNPFIAL